MNQERSRVDLVDVFTLDRDYTGYCSLHSAGKTTEPLASLVASAYSQYLTNIPSGGRLRLTLRIEHLPQEKTP